MPSVDLTYFMEELAAINKDRGKFIAHTMSFVRERAVAEDIYSESILKVLEKREKFTKGDNIKGYFFKVLISGCYDFIKRQSRLADAHTEIRNTALRDAMVDILAERKADSMSFITDLEDRIASCRQRLPDRSFEVFMASRMDGLTYKEIAEKFSISTRQVTSDIQRALVVFRSVFGDLLVVFVMLFRIK